MLATDYNPMALASQGVPPGLDEMAPGPVLAVFLSSVDVNEISGYDQILVLRAHQRMASHYQAHVYTDMTAIADSLADIDRDPQFGADFAAGEIRAALTLTGRAADVELSFAMDLRERLPKVHEMLACGAIDVRRARTIEYGTAHLPVGVARGVVARIAEAAPDLTTGELGHRIRKLCIETDTNAAKKRYDYAVDGRKIVAEPCVDGTANLLGLNLAPDRVAAVTHRINKIARSLRANNENRSMDQLRADVYLDLLTGTQSNNTQSRGVVHMTVDIDTLVGLADHPGDLNGFAPVISDIARQVATDQPDAQWRWTVTDTETNQPLRTGITSRRPTATQRRYVETRDRTCVFPGCRASIRLRPRPPHPLGRERTNHPRQPRTAMSQRPPHQTQRLDTHKPPTR